MSAKPNEGQVKGDGLDAQVAVASVTTVMTDTMKVGVLASLSGPLARSE